MTKYQKIFVVAGLCVAFAATAVIVSPGVQADEVVRTGANNVFTGINQFPSIKIGAQGVGGVTFFNGSIVNATTDDAGNDNPVTFGDNVRIDGALSRGPDASKPVWVTGGLKVEGDIEGIDIGDVTNLQSDLDGKASSSAAYTKSESDGRYYTQSTANSTFYPRTTADSTFVSKSSPSWDAVTRDVMISGADIIMGNPTNIVDYRVTTSAGYYLDGSAGSSRTVYAPVQLPDGATAKSITFYFNDSDGSDNMTVQLHRSTHTGGLENLSDEIVSVDGGSGNVSDLSLENASIDNSEYAYFIRCAFSDDTKAGTLTFRQVNVQYEATTPI
ncbi:hypothetical protein ACFL2B_00445 [Patescibacteria group bacterium]